MPKIPIEEYKKGFKDETITVETDLKSLKVVALVYGRVGVHASVSDNHIGKGVWSVTSTTTGIGIVYVGSQVDALKIAKYLSDNFLLALRKTTKEDILSSLPDWVKRWCIACNRAGTYLPPDTFRS